jgi:hypothetical protein
MIIKYSLNYHMLYLYVFYIFIIRIISNFLIRFSSFWDMKFSPGSIFQNATKYFKWEYLLLTEYVWGDHIKNNETSRMGIMYICKK